MIREPEIKETPTHEKWTFTAIDDGNFLVSTEDLRRVAKYINDLELYGSEGWQWVEYYITELESFNPDK